MASGSPAINKIERAHQMYREGKYAEALDYYTDALFMAKTTPQKIALHSNRAACFLKLHDFNKAAEECTSVLELDYNHTGALMLRAQTLVTLKEYHSALFDVNRLIELNPSSEVYRNLHTRLKTQLSLAPIPEDEAEFEEDDEYLDEDKQEPYEEELDDEKIEDLGSSGSDVTRDAAKNNNGECNFEDVSLTEEILPSQNMIRQLPSDQTSSGWRTIPKPKGHSQLDYSRWDRVQDDSSEEDDDDDEDDEDDDDSQPQYRFRVKTVGVKAVK
ncbi:uncharacterized protein LOC130986032 [Salvia miltiorrhiza]|uniref:uncharacterized protein LOC130986032 n=1 Tax=Salvia miltiorrhiza TaxID=226208 RepID=UPI0025AD02C5|nr:uncharacterized protein LOC130986032 [Salvia miltiorrhiza]